jgi:hypothetical protein
VELLPEKLPGVRGDAFPQIAGGTVYPSAVDLTGVGGASYTTKSVSS